MATHGKVGSTYYFYQIIENDGTYELTIELNKKVVKQIKSTDDKWLRAYAKGYIDFYIQPIAKMRRTKTMEGGFTQLKKYKRTFTWVENRNHPEIKVDMYLKLNDKGQIVFSCTGWVCCEARGQCEDDIDKYLKGDKVWDKIYYLWKTHHLNDMHAGTPKQENLLKMGRLAGVDLSNYDKKCKFLKEYNCYFDDNIVDGTSHPYKYGSEWLYRPIPEVDLWEILSLLLED